MYLTNTLERIIDFLFSQKQGQILVESFGYSWIPVPAMLLSYPYCLTSDRSLNVLLLVSYLSIKEIMLCDLNPASKN